ncbi:MAG: hypothetical protein KF794_08705 [Xanthobacteraceae bacterium]|nr:hypothetical protein [Xanthobacteraceae bacterium]QYK43886.1 MAG: hypothetical protein KF794_08705 [Xanthobacteraceae bacterium]
MFQRWVRSAVFAFALTCAGCTTFNIERDDLVTFVFAQPTTECDIYLGNTHVGRVSVANAALGVPKGDEPLRLACVANAFAPVSAEVTTVRTRDQTVGVLGVNVPTPRALGARVVEPITGAPRTGYPPRIIIDLAQRTVTVPDGWQARM